MTGNDLCVCLYKSVPVIFEPPCIFHVFVLYVCVCTHMHMFTFTHTQTQTHTHTKHKHTKSQIQLAHKFIRMCWKFCLPIKWFKKKKKGKGMTVTFQQHYSIQVKSTTTKLWATGLGGVVPLRGTQKSQSDPTYVLSSNTLTTDFSQKLDNVKH